MTIQQLSNKNQEVQTKNMVDNYNLYISHNYQWKLAYPNGENPTCKTCLITAIQKRYLVVIDDLELICNRYIKPIIFNPFGDEHVIFAPSMNVSQNWASHICIARE